MPAEVIDLELTCGSADIEPRSNHEETRILVRWAGKPVGWLRMPSRELSVRTRAHLLEALSNQLGPAILEHVGKPAQPHEDAPDAHTDAARAHPNAPHVNKDAAPARMDAAPARMDAASARMDAASARMDAASARMDADSARTDEGAVRPISVIVCTRDRTQQLQGCLDALHQIAYPRFEVVVVDNAPSTDATARLVESTAQRWAESGRGASLRYVREIVPGLNAARNCGAAAARFDIVAFTDDDVQVDPNWLQGLNWALADPHISAVTGLVVPLELETDAQSYFEDVYGGMGKGFRPAIFNARVVNESAWWPSACGVGANMAFRRAVLDAVGGFDERLDVGTPSRGGGDIEMFDRILFSGYTIRYEPTAMVRHRHRRTAPALRRQLFDNGCSFGVFLLTRFFRPLSSRRRILKLALWEWIGRWMIRRLVRPGRHRRRMILPEMAGMMWSPAAYLLSRRPPRAGAHRSLRKSGDRPKATTALRPLAE